jgi:hypothetical protein
MEKTRPVERDADVIPLEMNRGSVDGLPPGTVEGLDA